MGFRVQGFQTGLTGGWGVRYETWVKDLGGLGGFRRLLDGLGMGFGVEGLRGFKV